MNSPPQQISDQEIDLRTYLSRHLEPRHLSRTLTQQVVEYGMLCAVHATASIPLSVAEAQAAVKPLPWEEAAAPSPTAAPPELKLSADQELAWAKLQVWARNTKPFFVLRGYAGTGKTFLMQMLTQLPGLTFLFTAPTNKAAKVLGKSVGKPAKTIHSLLGLKMEPDGEKQKLVASKKPIYLPRGAIIVIDEASMVGKDLRRHIEREAERCGCKVMYVGDPAQLPPVGETMGSVWKCTDEPDCRAVLKEVRRFDNQLLALSVKVRECLTNKDYVSPVVSDHDKKGGVYKLSPAKFEAAFLKGVDGPDAFADRKIIAWRNKTVDRYNKIVRAHLGFTDEYCVGERLLMASPVEFDGMMLASVDDEVQITAINDHVVEVDGVDIPVYRLNVIGDDALTLHIPKGEDKLKRVLSKLASEAGRANGVARIMRWKEFWKIKNEFHSVRYGYALTAHRIQGSTVHTAYVDQMDILANPDKRTAFRCLYVGFTRPTTRLYTY